MPLTDQIAAMLMQRLGMLALRPGSRLPSIRAMAEHLGVSRFTVVEAYERLVAQGWLQARQGAGYFISGRAVPADRGAIDTRLLASQGQQLQQLPQEAREAGHTAAPVGVGGEVGMDPPCAALVPATSPLLQPQLDVAWLLGSTLRDVGGGFIPGSSALLPHHWLDAELLAAATRSVGRSAHAALLGYGQPRGYAPLRASIAAQLQSIGIAADGERHLLLTSGVTHAVDLVLRAFTRPGDTVLVEDPAWFLVFGRLAAAGVRVLGVPRTPAGPDLQVLEELARKHRPRLFIINSAIHNPTGYSLPARSAHAILNLAERHDFLLFEDDTYGELHPGGAIRLAALDGLERVIHVGGFSKTLAASLRVAYVAAAPALIGSLTDLKLLSGLTTPELPERVVQKVLADGHYQRHLQRVREQVDAARHSCLRFFADLGLRIEAQPVGGMFLWVDCRQDSEQLARRAAARNLLLAPGRLFSPSQAPDTHVRFAVSLAESAPTRQIVRELLERPLG
nr:PLP-dependent aminotransferase family protein [Corticibacter populi]